MTRHLFSKTLLKDAASPWLCRQKATQQEKGGRKKEKTATVLLRLL